MLAQKKSRRIGGTVRYQLPTLPGDRRRRRRSLRLGRLGILIELFKGVSTKVNSTLWHVYFPQIALEYMFRLKHNQFVKQKTHLTRTIEYALLTFSHVLRWGRSRGTHK